MWKEKQLKVLIINPPWPGKGYGTRSQNRIIKRRGDKYLQYPIFLSYSAAQLKKLVHDLDCHDYVIRKVARDYILLIRKQDNSAIGG